VNGEVPGARRHRRGVLAMMVLLALASAQARAETAEPAPPSPAAAPIAPPPGAASDRAPLPAPATPSYLELAERLRLVGSFSECAVEALRYGYDHPGDRPRGFERAALCLSLAGRHDDARRLMLALPSEGAALDGPGRLRICLAEVFLLDLGAPACPALESEAPRDRYHALGLETLRMRTIRARRWDDARKELAAAPLVAAPDPTASAWREQDRELIRRYDTLPRKSPVLAAALSMVVPGLGRVYIGRWPDGLMSFLVIGSTAFLAGQGFYAQGEGSVRGWILGGLAGLLYVGNVYGSAVGAVVQRRDAETALMQEVDRAYEHRLDP
jgi:hypothetical protein